MEFGFQTVDELYFYNFDIANKKIIKKEATINGNFQLKNLYETLLAFCCAS